MENKMEPKEEVQRRRLQVQDDSSSSRAARWVTATAVEIELELLDCTICYRPLKPPVFQCSIGHVVCSCCHAQLAGRRCPTCGAATDFSRCFTVEQIVDSVRVPCANAGRGCPAKPAYHGKEEHEETCPHAHADEVMAVTDPVDAATDAPDVPEHQAGKDRGSRGQNLIAGLVLASVSMMIPAAIPVVRDIIIHFSLQGACSRRRCIGGDMSFDKNV